MVAPDKGVLEPRRVVHFTRTLSKAERNNSATERECLGVECAIELLLPYLEDTEFSMRSDYEPLEWLLNLWVFGLDGYGRLAR